LTTLVVLIFPFVLTNKFFNIFWPKSKATLPATAQINVGKPALVIQVSELIVKVILPCWPGGCYTLEPEIFLPALGLTAKGEVARKEVNIWKRNGRSVFFGRMKEVLVFFPKLSAPGLEAECKRYALHECDLPRALVSRDMLFCPGQD
jgi:hypothetical protein